ncbi:hypothetical protein [Nocardia sp. alder85J]|nr:hypothetical protein [Nocardia sp. alder85J]MCX4098535.1 hypothetical protein [Nocardia sp. alder85J]
MTTLTPELTMAPHVPEFAALLPLHEASLVESHTRARQLATSIGTLAAA